MTAWPVLLSMEDVFVLIAVVLLLLARQRTFLIISIILAAILLVCNVLVISGYRNWFVLALPFVTLYIVAILGRPFLKRSVSAVSPKIGNALLIPAVVLLVLGVVLIVLAVLLTVLLRPR